jgi:hypothetical protein
MAADELRIKMLAENRLSEELKDANKAVRDLKKELVAAAKEAEGTGDYSKYRQLEESFQDASRRAGQLRGELAKVRREVKGTGDQTVKSAGLMKTAWGKLQKVTSSPLFTAVSIGAVTLFAKSAIQSFAEVEDATSALQSTFGESGDRIIAWANQSAIAFNLSRKEALTAAQTIAVFGDSAGLAGQELETFAISLTERAADAASFFGGTTTDAITAFGAALRGENEPIRRYGVLLDDATLRAKAFEMGLTDGTKNALTPQQKTLAAYNVIMEQTTRVQGDVARTSDSMANQIKQSQAQMENFKTTVGETLAVGLAPILQALNGVLRAFNGLPQPLKTVAVAMGLLGVAALVLGPRIAAISAEMRAAGVSAAGMGSKLKGAALFLGGPWGAALAVGTIALTHFLMEQAEANARVDEFANSIDSVTGKLNEAGVASVAEQLLTDINEDDWKTLERLGISLEDATLAVIGGADAWERFRDMKAEAVNRAAIGSEKGLLATLEANVMGLRSEVERGEAAFRAAQRAQEIAAGSYDDTADAVGGVTRQLVRAKPVLGQYRDAAYSASYAASALKLANQNAADATDRLTGGLQGLQATISEQQALAAYQSSLETFIANPSAETALAVSADMATAAAAIQDPGDRAKFTKQAIDDIRTAASDAGMKLNPELDKGLLRARGQAILLETQIDRAVRARVVDITLRFNDSRTTYGGTTGQGNGQRHGGWVTGSYGGPTSDLVPTALSRGEYVLRGGAAAALRAAIGDTGMWQLNHADRSMPSFLDSPVPPIALPSGGGTEPALVGAGAPVINIGEIKADAGIDVQAEVMWALRRADRIKRERS